MADAAVAPEITRQVEGLLDFLLVEWEAVPALEQQWAEWTEIDRLTFVEEWGIRRDRLATLRVLAQQGALDSGQRRRYEDLLALIEANTPILDRLFAS